MEGIDGVQSGSGHGAPVAVDRMATVLVPGTDRVQASFVGVAKHYGVGIDACPRGDRTAKAWSRRRSTI